MSYVAKTFLPELSQTRADFWQLVDYMSHGYVTHQQ
jgi:hypothetical protein